MSDFPEQPVVDDAKFMANVREGLGNGCGICCAFCGVGLAGDDMDIHERGCPEFVEFLSWSTVP